MKKGPKILLFDIETTNFNADLSPILCIGWKWLGEKKTHCWAIWEYECYDDLPYSKADRDLLEDFREVVEQADAIVGHYSDRFDIPFVNARMILHGMPPITGIPQVDTWKLARYNIKITSNRLKNIGKFLDAKIQKIDSGGWDTWLDVMRDDEKAQRRMVKYCKKDVEALEEIFQKLKPFAKNIPNYNHFKDAQGCHNCGSTHIKSNGWRYTKTAKYRRYICLSCGSVGRYDKKNEKPRGC